jgi:plasmid maintenance system antidote protein VapI
MNNMNSSKLIKQLKKEGISQYRIARILEVEDSRISHIKNRKQNFTADHLGKLKKAGLIDQDTLLKVNYYDNLKDKTLYKYVASILVSTGSLQFISQFQEGITTLVYYVKWKAITPQVKYSKYVMF